MDAIVKMLEKHQPFFEKISRNIYLQAIKDGFLGCMPIVLTSSIFLLIATLPGVVGITLPQPLIDWCNKLYNFTMGVMGIMVAGTTAKNFTASMNRRMPAGKVLNDGSTMVAAQCSMLLLAVTQSPPSSTAPSFRSSIAPAWVHAVCSRPISQRSLPFGFISSASRAI